MTPPSIRFLARRVYLGVWVILITALRHGPTGKRMEKLREYLDVSERTLVRWRRWWREDFAESGFWRALKGLFGQPVESDRLPASLVERFVGDEVSCALEMMHLLLPITGGQGLAGHRLGWAPEIRKRWPGPRG